MPRKIRKQMYIAPRHERALKEMAKRYQVPEAEILRRALDAYFQIAPLAFRDLAAWEEERAFIQRLIDQGPLPGPGRRTWRREELHDR